MRQNSLTGRIAALVADEARYGIARQGGAFAEQYGFEVCVFYSRDEALDPRFIHRYIEQVIAREETETVALTSSLFPGPGEASIPSSFNITVFSMFSSVKALGSTMARLDRTLRSNSTSAPFSPLIKRL